MLGMLFGSATISGATVVIGIRKGSLVVGIVLKDPCEIDCLGPGCMSKDSVELKLRSGSSLCWIVLSVFFAFLFLDVS